jgi:hypothetical protein
VKLAVPLMKHSRQLPRRGKKEQLWKPGNTDVKQKKKIEKRRKKLFSTLVSEKHIRTQNLATAVWIAERKEARVQVPKVCLAVYV